MERNSELEDLTKDFYYTFLRNPKAGGGYISKIFPADMVRYEAVGYNIEVVFTGKHQCDLKVTGPSNIKELMSIPYGSDEKPDWKKFSEGVFTLIKEKS